MNKRIRIAIIFGTRPEIIKLASFIKLIKTESSFHCITIFTNQHKDLGWKFLHEFSIRPDHVLPIRGDYGLVEKISNTLHSIHKIINPKEYDYILVQGDTLSSAVGALYGFYQKIKVIHVEAGLRTENVFSPWPEEFNRRLISLSADLHLCPSSDAVSNLIDENISQKTIHNIGNTGLDLVKQTLQNLPKDTQTEILNKYSIKAGNYIIITYHRRENYQTKLKNFIDIIKKLCSSFKDTKFLIVLHPNPKTLISIQKELISIENLKFIENTDYKTMLYLLNNCRLIITDSGGLQEEAHYLNKKCVVVRDTSERVNQNTDDLLILTDHDFTKIKNAIESDNKLIKPKCPFYFGDGNSATRAMRIIMKHNSNNRE